MNSVTPTRLGLRLTAAAGTIALASLALATPALAAPEYGNIDFAKTGSLTIHKHEYQAGTNTPPLVGDPAGSSTLPNPIGGVEFTVYKITSLPLNVATNWDTLSTLDAATATCPVPNSAAPAADLPGQTLDTPILLPATNATTGEATVTLPVAAYLVCETGFSTGAGGANIDRVAQPFVVTVPFPDNQAKAPTDSNGWLYQVHAYPKNTRAVTVTKTVDSQKKLGLGEKVTFPTTTGIPRIADNAVFTSYTIVDPMDPRLDPTGVTSVTVDDKNLDASYYKVVTDRNVLMVQFTQAGLTWLKTQGGKDVRVVFEGTVSSLDTPGFGLDDGKIYNQAYLVTDHETGTTPPVDPELPPLTPPDPTDPNKPVDPTDPFDPNKPTPPTTPSDKVTSNWGDLQLWKRDNQGGTNIGLNGARFEVYEAATPYPAAPDTCTKAVAPAASPVSVMVGGSPKTEFTSVDGVVAIPGLFVSDSANAPKDAPSRCYVVKEIAAPAGFILPTGDAAFSAVKVNIGKTAIVPITGENADLTIDNVRQEVPNLPFTGADGQLLLMAVGGALLLVAVGTVLVAARRRRVAAES